MTPNLERAEYGIGEASLHEAARRWAHAGRVVQFTNVSRTDTFRNCAQKYYWDYVHAQGGVVPEGAAPFHAFVHGTAIHEGAETLLQEVAHGRSAQRGVEAATERALQYADDQYAGLQLDARTHEKHQSFNEYIGPIIEAAAPKFDLIDEVWATEVVLWSCVPLEAHDGTHWWICVVGRLDAAVVDQGVAWHLQHKSREKEAHIASYITRLGFGAHETVYGWMMRETIARGLWGDHRRQVEYGGSKVALWLKQAPPSSIPEPMPKGLLRAEERGQVLVHEGGKIQRLDCTEKQWESAKSLHENWMRREERRIEQARSYTDRVVQVYDVDLDAEKMRQGFERQIRAAYLQGGIDLLKEPDLTIPGNTAACDSYSGCPHLETVTCGGWDTKNPFDPDSGWTHRQPDYIDEVREVYNDAFEDAVQ